MAIIKPVKEFTKENPCTKVDLHNCFAGTHGYVRRPVVEAQGEIGVNAPKYLIRKGYATYRSSEGIDYYELTTEGTVWLFEGLAAHLKRHPDDEAKVVRIGQKQAPVRVARVPLKAP